MGTLRPKSNVTQQKRALREICSPDTGHLQTPASGTNLSLKRKT
jgi:hypothetical protein